MREQTKMTSLCDDVIVLNCDIKRLRLHKTSTASGLISCGNVARSEDLGDSRNDPLKFEVGDGPCLGLRPPNISELLHFKQRKEGRDPMMT